MPIRRIRQAVLALMERDAELAAKTGQPIRADPQRARPIIATCGFRGLFEALKKGVPTASFSPPGGMITQVRLGCGPGIRHSRDASPCCCASLNGRHRPFDQIGA